MAELNEAYKRKNVPKLPGKTKFHQGYFTPKHPEKCLTKVNIYRSSLEYNFLVYCDLNPNILRYASEPIQIPYKNPEKALKQGLDPKLFFTISNYMVDMWIECLGENGEKRKIFIEIKSYAETQQPVMPESKNGKPVSANKYKAFNKAAITYLKNKAKWESAEKFCKERGCEFMIITEKTLKRLGMKI